MMQHTDITLIFEEILVASRCRRGWLSELIEEETTSVNGRPEQTLYSGLRLARVRRAQRLSRDSDAGTPTLGLIMRLLDEVEELRKAQRLLSLLNKGKQRPTKERSSEKQFLDGLKYYWEQPIPYTPEQPRDKPTLGSVPAQTDPSTATAPIGWHVAEYPPRTHWPTPASWSFSARL